MNAIQRTSCLVLVSFLAQQLPVPYVHAHDEPGILQTIDQLQHVWEAHEGHDDADGLHVHFRLPWESTPEGPADGDSASVVDRWIASHSSVRVVGARMTIPCDDAPLVMLCFAADHATTHQPDLRESVSTHFIRDAIRPDFYRAMLAVCRC